MLTYEGKLECAKIEIAQSRLTLNKYDQLEVSDENKWILDCISPDCPVHFYDTSNVRMFIWYNFFLFYHHKMWFNLINYFLKNNFMIAY